MHATYIDHMGDDTSVVNAARVSFAQNAAVIGAKVRSIEDNNRLIQFLARNKHYSPFNHTFVTMHVAAPVFVARQLQKHEYMPWNEVSRRYVNDAPDFFAPEVWRGKAENVKQGSGEPISWQDVAHQDYQNLLAQIEGMYKAWIKGGMSPEQARMILPQSMYTQWYWSGTLKAWAKMCSLRLDPHAQEESRFIAQQASNVLEELFPVSWAALRENFSD